MAQFSQRLGFDLANAFAGHAEVPAHFLKRVLRTIFQPETHLDDFRLTRGQCVQSVRGLLFQVNVNDGLCGRDRCPVLASWRTPQAG